MLLWSERGDDQFQRSGQHQVETPITLHRIAYRMDPYTPLFEPTFEDIVRLIDHKFHTIVQVSTFDFVAEVCQPQFIVRSTTTPNQYQCDQTIGILVSEHFQSFQLQYMIFFGSELTNRYDGTLTGCRQVINVVGQICHIARWE